MEHAVTEICMRLSDPWVQHTYRIGNILIFAAYCAIPGAIAMLRILRPDMIPRRIAYTFCAFILLCGLSHWLENQVLEYAWYQVLAIEIILTGIVSIATAAMLWLMMASILRAPSVEEYERAIKRQHEAEITLHATDTLLASEIKRHKSEDVQSPETTVAHLEELRAHIGNLLNDASNKNSNC